MAHARPQPALPPTPDPSASVACVNGPLLTLLTLTIAALIGLGVLAVAWQRHSRLLAQCGCGFAGLGTCFALAALLLGDVPATLLLPLGLPDAAFRLTLDPLVALFAALVFAVGAAILAATATGSESEADTGLVALCLGFLGAAILASGDVARGAGIALAGGAIWAAGPPNRARTRQLGVFLLAGAALVAVSAAPPQARLWAAILGPGALAGLAPLHAWFAPAHRAPAPAAALLSGAAVPVAVYAMLRLLFGAPAVVPLPWWGLPLLMLGAASVLAGGFDATRRDDLDTAVAANSVRQTGLIAIGLGIALTARAADLPAVCAMALAAVVLLAIIQALCGTLLSLAAGAIHYGAGTSQFDRLGGVVHRMPRTAICLLAGLFGLAALPPSPGFAAVWLLFQALLGLPHAGSLPFQLLLCTLIAVLGGAAALAAASLLRVIGVACLGRPRTPRAAVAEEPPRPTRAALQGLAAVAVLAGVFVGPLLGLLADPPIRALAGTGLGAGVSWLGVAPGPESPGYAALPVTILLLLPAGAVLAARRRRSSLRGTISGPAWEGGFAAPPAWLPFGDPTTQSAGAGFVPPSGVLPGRAQAAFRIVCAPVGSAIARTTTAAAKLRAPAAMLILAAALLALCAWTGAP